MLSFFIAAIVRSQPKELEDIGGVHIFGQFLD